MTKFEQVGVNIQHTSRTKEDAQQKLKYSCDCCCNRGLQIKCDKCAIEITHKLVMASLDTQTININNGKEM